MKTILWIEDDSNHDVVKLCPAVQREPDWIFHIVPDVTQAISRIKSNRYDTIVLDIRIEPGRDKNWENLYIKKGASKNSARLGIELLYSMLNPRNDSIKVSEVPKWFSKHLIGILTVESLNELKDDLKNLVICEERYIQKKGGMSKKTLKNLIKRILSNK